MASVLFQRLLKFFSFILYIFFFYKLMLGVSLFGKKKDIAILKIRPRKKPTNVIKIRLGEDLFSGTSAGSTVRNTYSGLASANIMV